MWPRTVGSEHLSTASEITVEVDSPRVDSVRAWWLFASLIAASLALHSIVAVSLPLSGDEAYYWDCSRHLDWSYFDMPPLAIWSIAAARSVFGDTRFAVRAPAIVSSAVTAVFVAALVRRLGGSVRVAASSYLLMHAMPLFFIGFSYASTDVVMTAAFTAAVHAAVAIAQGEVRAWWGFGSAVAIGFLGKFSSILALAALIGALTAPAAAASLKTLTPYLAAGLSFGLTIPVWIWGYRHHWDNVLFQLVERHHFRGLGLGYLAEFLGTNLVLVSPLLGLALAAAWWDCWRRRDIAFRVVTLAAIAPFVVFGLAGLGERIGPHWTAPGLVLMSICLAISSFRAKKALVSVGALTGVLFSLVLLSLAIAPASWMTVTLAYPWDAKKFSTASLADVIGESDIATDVERRLYPGELAASESYGAVHLVAFDSGGRVPTCLARITGGAHGLSSLYWYPPRMLRGRDVLFFTESPSRVARLVGLFDSITEEDPFLVKAGDRTIRTIRFYRCRNLQHPEGTFTRLQDVPS